MQRYDYINFGDRNKFTQPVPVFTASLSGPYNIFSTDQMLTNDPLQRADARRAINNQKWDEFGNNAMSALPGAISFMGQAFNAFNNGHTSDDILADTRKVNQSVGGVGYQTYGAIDSTGAMRDLHKSNVGNTLGLMASGASAGSAFGPIGTAIGGALGGIVGLIGGGHRHTKEREMLADAQAKANRYNMYNRSVAATQAAQGDFRNMYGNYENAPLHAANGLEMAYTSANETVDNRQHPELSGRVPGTGKEGDWIPTPVEQGTGNVFTNNGGINGVSYADLAIGPVMALKSIQTAVNSVKGKQAKTVTENVLAKYKKKAEDSLDSLAYMQHQDMEPIRQSQGEVQHAANGLEFGNLLTSLTGGLIGLGQYFGAKNQRVKSPSTYVPNTQANRAFDLLSGLRISQKPIMDQINRDAASARYRLANSGGLSGAQKYLGNIALTANTQTARAKALQDIQEQNNSYLAAEAQARLTNGAQEAQNLIASNRWDLDYYSKAHAARQQGMQMGLYNSLAQLQQYAANASKLKMFDKMYNLYSKDVA